MQHVSLRLFAMSLALAPTATFAHTGHGEIAGFAHGFMHPIGGLDHILAMVSVGILAWQLGGRALWLLPAVFVLLMGIGGILGAANLQLPFVELAIASSVIVLGAAIASGVKAPAVAVAAIAGMFAVFHGFAHGTEMPATGSAAQYATGFMTATVLLHVLGIGIGLALGRFGRGYGPVLYRIAGCLVVIAGVAILAQSV